MDAQTLAFIDSCKRKIRTLTIVHCVIVLVAATGLIVTGQFKWIDIAICLASVLSVKPYHDEDLRVMIPFFCLILRPFFIMFHIQVTSTPLFIIFLLYVDPCTAFIRDAWVYSRDYIGNRTLAIVCTFTTLTELAYIHFYPADAKELSWGALVCALLMLLYATKTTGLKECIEKTKHYQDAVA